MLREAAGERLSCAYPSRVTIDGSALAANVRLVKSVVGAGVELMAVVKANAYGHGAVAVADIALRQGASRLAVANLGEAIELRKAGIDAPILLLSATSAEAVPAALRHNLSVTLYDAAQTRALQAAADYERGRLTAHVKVDTGMGRLGVLAEDAREFCLLARAQPHLRLEGIYTHFSTADCDRDYTAEQLARFNSALDELARADIRFDYVHAANSAALLTCPGSRFNLARAGLALYGLNPLANGDSFHGLRPVLSWKTRIAQVKTLPHGSPVGYGNGYRTRGRETIAVLPVGYAAGLRRSPYSWREVLVHGRRAPLVGRVSMEKTTIRVSHIPGARIGDEVVLLGKQCDDEICADEIAEWIGSINYEVVTAIAPRTPRTLK